jgi:shikimate dehydrogenase
MLIFDMVYRSTRLLQEAEAQGARILNGKGMLVRQAGLAFQRWTNQPAPIPVMMQAFDQDTH